MIDVGFSTVEPRTGTRTRVVEGTDMGWVLEVECPAGAPPHILEHVHQGWDETFEILEGRANYKLDGRQGSAAKGETIPMPPGQTHIHPWNAGDGVMVYRQTNKFDRPAPEALHDVIGVFATINGLAREGKVGSKGLPKNPLQFAATLRTLVKHEGFDAAVPVGAQRALSATLGRVAEAFGYRGVYPRYIEGAA